MILNPYDMKPREVYQILIGIINPRPIAWVSTQDARGRTNLAPYSFFNGISANPPSLLFCPANNRDGIKKDTLLNIEETGEFVVNVVPHELAGPMSDSSAPLPHGESEFEACNLETAPASRVKPPLLKVSPVNIECKLKEIVRVGDGPLAGNVVIGIIQCMHLDDQVLDPAGMPDPEKLDLIGRMGGTFYSRTRDRFEIPRPK